MDHPSAQVPPEPPQPANVANVHELSQAAHEELRSNNERLKLLLDLNNAIVSNLELRDLLRAISAGVRHMMKCDSVGVALPDPNDQRLRIHAVDFQEGRGLIREESKVPAAEGPTNRVFRIGEPIALDARGFHWSVATAPWESYASAGCTTNHLPGMRSISSARWRRRLRSRWKMP